MKNETQSNTKVCTITQRLCLYGSVFKLYYAMVGSFVNDHFMMVDLRDASCRILAPRILSPDLNGQTDGTDDHTDVVNNEANTSK